MDLVETKAARQRCYDEPLVLAADNRQM